jgi:hypothetical protein
MHNTAYRLAEYKIVENEHGDLWWETHIGLGSLRIGKCFINGDILFIKPSDSTGPGFLKGEFLDHLNRLPKWEKTTYFCASYKIYKCKSGSRKPIFKGMDSRLQKIGILGKNISTQKEIAEGTRKSVKVDTATHFSYKLGGYEITEKNDGQLFWKSYIGLGRLKKGRCHVKGSILFLEPGVTELSGLKKREFLQQLIRLPDWQGTQYFCTSYDIYCCKTGAICRRFGVNEDLRIDDDKKNVVFSKKTFVAGIKIKPIILNKVTTNDKLSAFFNFCSLLMILILNLLLGCFKILYKISSFFIGKLTRFRG